MSAGRVVVFAILVILIGIAITLHSDIVLRDIDGNAHGTLERPENANWNVLFFLTSDCPIGNQYAPEIQRICLAYGTQGTRCFLVFVDSTMTGDAIRKYMNDFKYTCCTPIHDSDHRLVRHAGAQVSSEVAVIGRGGEMKYRGRINDFYASLGMPRQFVSSHDLRNALDDLVAGRDVRTPRTEAIGCFIQN